MNIQFLIVLLCVGGALVYLLRPWWRRVRAGSRPDKAAGAEPPQSSACGACKGCSGRSGGCH
ncbi:hypothetical protein [Hydrogenophaga flava]|uniref:hypothetical protein n=1 Tax=Hydrogenophaga flava TaxID=65657 RepID=UPI0008270854|nr:hypothetical protein [Hydrogenophaga flava]